MKITKILSLVVLILISFPEQYLAQTITHEIVVGAVTDNSVEFVLRTDEFSIVQVELSTTPEFTNSIFSSVANTADDQDNFGKVYIKGLNPNTLYYYRAIINDDPVGESITRSFKTFPAENSQNIFSFITGSCQTPPTNNGIFNLMLLDEPAFYIQQGDWGYPDTTKQFPVNYDFVAQSYRERYSSKDEMKEILRNIPVVYTFDDHDFGGNNNDSTQAGKENVFLGYQNMFPHYELPHPQSGIWQKFSYGNCDFFILDNRSERSPNINAFQMETPDSLVFDPPAGHSIIGGLQKDWLLDELNNSTAQWKFISTGTAFNPAFRGIIEYSLWLQGTIDTIPFPGGSTTPQDIAISVADKWAGFPEDIIDVIETIRENNIENVIFLSGDSHSSAIDNGANSIFPEVMSGPIDAFNSKILYLLELFGLKIFNSGGHLSDLPFNEFGNAYGRVNVFGSDSVRLEIVTEEGDVIGTATVPSGYLPPANSINVSPRFLIFEDVPVDIDSTLPLIITSLSYDTLTIDNLEMIGSDYFTYNLNGESLPLKIPPNQKRFLNITYSPNKININDEAILSIYSNDPLKPEMQIALSGTGDPPLDVEEEDLKVKEFKLYQNYPNPFNPETNIKYQLKELGFVTLKIYDVLGNEIKTLVNEVKEPGFYNVKFSGNNLSSGIYFYKIDVKGKFSTVKKMILMR